MRPFLGKDRRKAVKQRRGDDQRNAEHNAMFHLGKDVQRILNVLEDIMAAIDDLRAEVATLQATVDADQASDAAVVAAMQAEIDRLTGELANGATAAQVAEVVEALRAISADVSGPNA